MNRMIESANNEGNVNFLKNDLVPVVTKNLKKLLEQHGITQEKLAAATGVSKAAVNDYIKGKRLPSLEFMAAIMNLYDISLNVFLTRDINPVDYVIPKESDAHKQEYKIAQKYFGSFYAYYLDTANYRGRDSYDASAALRYGIFLIYENPGSAGKTTYGSAAVLGLDDINEADQIKAAIDSFPDASAAFDYIANNHSNLMYRGSFDLGEKHVFLTLEHGDKDKALAIFYKIHSSKQKNIGSMGTINSVCKGRESSPTIQFIGITRDKVQLSSEEIFHTLLLNYPTFRVTTEADEMIDLFNRLYMAPKDRNGRQTTELSDWQKTVMVKANLERYINESLKRNMFQYGKISNRDDDEWYHLLKEVTDLPLREND